MRSRPRIEDLKVQGKRGRRKKEGFKHKGGSTSPITFSLRDGKRVIFALFNGWPRGSKINSYT